MSHRELIADQWLFPQLYCPILSFFHIIARDSIPEPSAPQSAPRTVRPKLPVGVGADSVASTVGGKIDVSNELYEAGLDVIVNRNIVVAEYLRKQSVGAN